jgi:hypothetical protein
MRPDILLALDAYLLGACAERAPDGAGRSGSWSS